MSRTYGKATDLIDFTRASSGTALRRVKYGAELVTNGTFDNDVSGWIDGGSAAPTLNAVSGQAVASATITGSLVVDQTSMNFEAGKLYQIKIDLISTTDPINVFNFIGSSSIISALSVGTNVINYVASADGYLRIGATSPTFASGEGFTVDNVSVKEVTFDTSDGDLILFNHPANIPRIEYDANGNLLGLLVEESRTNLITYSDFSSGWDVSSVTVTANSVLSPDGQVKGAEANLTNSGGFLYDTISVTAGTAYTWSWYAKAGTATAWILAVYDETNAVFVTRQEYTISSGESVGNGWYRHSYTFTAPTGCTSARVYPIRGLSDTGSPAGALGTTYLYNAQVEVGSFPTSAIPTSGSTATRSADVASLSTSAFGYRQDEGSVVVEFSGVDDSGTGRLVSITDNTGNNSYAIQQVNGSTTSGRIRVGGVDYMFGNKAAVTTGKAALLYSDEYAQFVLNGSAVAPDTSVATATMTVLGVGNNAGSSNATGHIKSVKYYPRVLTESQLEALTA